jgi:hypothetical protein
MGRYRGDGREKRSCWASNFDPAAGRVTKALGPITAAVIYLGLLAGMVVAVGRLPDWLEVLPEAAILYLFVDFLGWANEKITKDEPARRRNRAWLRALAAMFLLGIFAIVVLDYLRARLTSS